MEKRVNLKFDNVYFINGTAYAGKSTMVKLLAEKYNGIACEENYHDRLLERPDKEKQFLYQLLLKEDEPEKALDNFRECLKRVNSVEIYNEFLNSGF